QIRQLFDENSGTRGGSASALRMDKCELTPQLPPRFERLEKRWELLLRRRLGNLLDHQRARTAALKDFAVSRYHLARKWHKFFVLTTGGRGICDRPVDRAVVGENHQG